MTGPEVLARSEDTLDRAQVTTRIEALLPAGVRPRQLTVRTLILGMLLILADHRPAHLTRVHASLTALPEADQARLGVTAVWKNGLHQLTYRQTEYTFGAAVRALSKQRPDGAPAEVLAGICDDLLEATIPPEHKDTSRALAAGWSDLESFSCPPPAGTRDCADPEATWGHRKGGGPGQHSDLFFGYFLNAATMIGEEQGPAVPELARRMAVTTCHLDPARAIVPALQRLPAAGIPLGDILADSGYAHRVAANWAVPLRTAGAQLIQDLHPDDRGPRGTHNGAIISNGNLYCPATPKPLLHLGPLARDVTPEQVTAHDQQTEETARYKLGRITSDDTDGYHRVTCPAAAGKIRCPHRPGSLTLSRDRPEILAPPQNPPTCCQQQTITVPPHVAAKTRQKHDYPSPAHRRSYARRTSSERTFSTIKDPAATTIARGWCRLTGVTPLALRIGCLLAVRNQRIRAAWDARQADKARRAAAGLPPRTRKRRRRTLASLAAGPP